MLSFDYISELIHGLLEDEGIKDFPLKYVKKLLEYRNNMLELFELYNFDWFPLPKNRKSKRIKEELEFREDVCFSLNEDFKFDGLAITNEIIDKVFSYERLILPYVGNLRSYYDMLIELKLHKKVDFHQEYSFDKWTKWKKCINAAVEDYILDFGVYPNFLIANEHTLSQINFLINNIPGEKKDIYHFDVKTHKDVRVDEKEEIELEGYVCDAFQLQFAANEKVNDKVFILFYRDHPDIDDDDDDRDDEKAPVSPSPVGIEIPVKV